MENNINHDSETINEFLLELSDDIIFINIEEQIKDANNNAENYFEFIIDKLDALSAVLSAEEDGPLLGQIEQLKEEVCDLVQRLLQEKFGFTCDFKCYSDRSKCLLQIYKFFVIRKKEILLNLVNNFIEREYKSLVLRYSKTKINKKDISYLNNKKTIDKENMNILLNLHKIISSIEFDSVEELMDLLIDDKDEFTYNFILTMYQQEEILFDIGFISAIKEELRKENNYIIMETRMRLLEKIKK